jgi:hypothetical protein
MPSASIRPTYSTTGEPNSVSANARHIDPKGYRIISTEILRTDRDEDHGFAILFFIIAEFVGWRPIVQAFAPHR